MHSHFPPHDLKDKLLIVEDVLFWQNKFENYLSQLPNKDGSHDLNHFKRVWNLAQRLASDSDDQLTLLAACYFHDLVNYPKDHPQRSKSSQESAKLARDVLLQMEFPKDRLENVCHCIKAHSFSANIETKTNEAKVVQDADRMEALGAIGLARTFYVAGQLGTKLFCPEDPFARQREYNDALYAIDHFYLKLLKLPPTMKTAAGKMEAEVRVQVIKKFLEDLKTELAE